MKRIVDVRSVACPTCLAAVGYPCMQHRYPLRRTKNPHPKRRSAAIAHEDATRWSRRRADPSPPVTGMQGVGEGKS